jgi:hypothetical protein
MPRRSCVLLAAIVLVLCQIAARAEDAFYDVPLTDLKIVAGEMPKPDEIYSGWGQPKGSIRAPGANAEAMLPQRFIGSESLLIASAKWASVLCGSLPSDVISAPRETERYSRYWLPAINGITVKSPLSFSSPMLMRNAIGSNAQRQFD